MGSSSRVVCIGLLASLSLAGCVGEAPPAPLASPQGPGATVARTDGDGSLRGVVVDDEDRPIEKASIGGVHRQTPNATFEVTTDASGTFLAMGLLPGSYIVNVGRIGYRQAPGRSIDVPAGEVQEVRFTLTALPLLEPFHQTKTYRTQWREQFGVQAPPPVGYIAGATGYTTTNVTTGIEINEEVQGDLSAFIVEMEWTAPVAACPGAFRSDVYSPEQPTLDSSPGSNTKHQVETNPFHWDNVPERVRSPTHLFIPRSGDNVSAMLSAARSDLNAGTPIETSGKWTIQIYGASQYGKGVLGTPVDIVCIVETTVTAHATTFFMEVPTADWSVLKQA